MRNFAIGFFVLVAFLGALATMGRTTLTSVTHHNSNGVLDRVEYIDSVDYVHRVEHLRLNGTQERVDHYYTGFCHYCSPEERRQFKRLKRVDYYNSRQMLERSLEYSFSGGLRKAKWFRLDGSLEQVDYFYRDGTVEMSEHYAFSDVVQWVDEFRPNGTLELRVFLDSGGEPTREHLFATDGKTLELVRRFTPG